MDIEIRVPEVGESVREARLAEWFKADGDTVRKDEPVFLLETDKITLEVPAGGHGVLQILVPGGSTVSVGDLVGKIRTETAEKGSPEAQLAPVRRTQEGESEERPEPQAAGADMLSPSVQQLVEEKGLDAKSIPGTGPGGRITRGDVMLFLEARGAKPVRRKQPAAEYPEQPAEGQPPASGEVPVEPREGVTRKPMSPIRRRIAERLLEAVNTTAMLTTFNEVDMSRVMALRKKYKEAFRQKHGVSLGIVSFFIKAVTEALQEFRELNAFIDGEDVVYHPYCDIGVAIGAERGLVVPVVRHAEKLGLAGIERAVAAYVEKISRNRLELSDLEGGTFTVTNGGVFGSLLSTPILNPPQSGILGLHKVEERPVVVDGKIEIRPMMYVAMTYDHRIVDGREAVQFLVRVKGVVEDPERMLMEV